MAAIASTSGVCALPGGRVAAGARSSAPPAPSPIARQATALSSTASPSFAGRAVRSAGRASAGVRRAARTGVVWAQEVSDLPKELQKIVMAFQMVPDPMARYKQLLFFASKLPPLADDLHAPENKVEGCVSQVWVVPTIKDGLVYFEADSDSQLTKGLAALLCQGLSGSKPEEILSVTPDFVEMLGLKQSLTPSRNNGFLNMLLKMQKSTLELVQKTEAGEVVEGEGGSSPEPEAGGFEDPDRPIYSAIVNKLGAGLQPTELDIEDQSAQHAGHAGMNGVTGTETHFAVRVVSAAFDGMRTVKRHRLIYSLLDAELQGSLHALSLDTKTPEEVSK